MEKFAYILSSITPVADSELRAVTKVTYDGKEYWACGDRSNYLHIFQKSDTGNDFECLNSFRAHNGWISSIAQIEPCQWFSDGALITGGHDNKVKVWDLKTLVTPTTSLIQPICTLSHDAQVCFVSTTPNHLIISCSWDSTCHVWSSPYTCITLTHEQYAIWSATSIPNGYITLGADRTIRVWDLNGRLINRLNNVHSDVPRACLYIPSRNILVTAANDGTIKEWQLDGTNLTMDYTITVTDKFLYSLTLIDDETYLTTSEDRCAYIVSGDLKKVVEAIPLPDSVWSATVLSNNDIIIACADGFVRTFTTSQERRCNLSTEETYITQLEGLTFSNPEFERINILDLPDVNSLTTESCVPGQAILARDGDKMVIYTWSTGYQRWLKIGTAVKQEGTSRNKVFDENGKQWDYCFDVQMEDGRVFPLYLNYDTNPYTAAYEFMARHDLDRTYLNQIVQFIEDQRKSTVIETTTTTNEKNSIFPMTILNIYSEISIAPIIRKLKSLNNHSQYIVKEEEFNLLEQNVVTTEMFKVIYNVVKSWPPNDSWPILDILRARITIDGCKDIIFPIELVDLINYFSSLPDLTENCVLMLMRIIANMFKSYSQEALNLINIKNVINKYLIYLEQFTKRTQIAYAMAMLNYSEFLSNAQNDAKDLMNMVISALEMKLDNDAIYRLIYAAGNCCVFSNEALNVLRLRPDLIDNLMGRQINEQLKAALKELIDLIQ
ncbi:phospholipase A-2-activating protein [Histomonas meleagridis]|uniref:phospholipase A-2-activating protein n=1 Tax=Histomonas meleagridis TaxID=135588 RepID=UPI00355AA691|nr:phospholipase A-2-activating protein [Histomonas meleagridis]KAH0797863.1 phospholipase A-2-activating protein [Histomonas meleagridis]